MDKRRIQIIGWLLGFCSLLILGSMIGYDASEEPSLVSSSINNPFNIVGVYVGYYLIKLGFGYAAYMIPIIGLTGAGYWDFREFGGIPADKSSNSNQSDVNFVVPGAADSGNMYTVIAEFQKIY